MSGLIFLSACSMSQNKDKQAFEAIYAGKKARVIKLVQRDVDINAADEEGNSLLMMAAWHGKEDIAQWLLDNGVTVDQEDNYSKTALIYAADQGHASVVKLLLEHGADINKVDEFAQQKPLDYAVARDHEDVVKIMLDLKGNELAQEDRQAASEKTKNLQIKRLLLQHFYKEKVLK